MYLKGVLFSCCSFLIQKISGNGPFCEVVFALLRRSLKERPDRTNAKLTDSQQAVSKERSNAA
jgi:hypothetical protein